MNSNQKRGDIEEALEIIDRLYGGGSVARMNDDPIHETWHRIKDLPRGTFLRKQQFSKKTFIRGEYDRASKSYSVINAEDINDEYFIRSTTKVWAGFVY